MTQAKPAETASDIAARYGATIKSSTEIKRVPRGVSGMPPLVWSEKKGLVYAKKPDLQRLSFSGRPPKAVTVDGRTWRSMTDLAKALGVSLAAVSKGVRTGKIEAMVRSRMGGDQNEA